YKRISLSNSGVIVQHTVASEKRKTAMLLFPSMYTLAIHPFLTTIRPMLAGKIEGFNVLILFLNAQAPDAPNQLKVAHCVAALYRSINTMTEGVMFNQLRCNLKIHGARIGTLEIAPVELSHRAAPTNASSVDDDFESKARTNASAVDRLGAPSGQITDDEHPEFGIKFHFFGKSILSKEVALVILEALAMAAPFNRYTECKEHEALSPDGGCAIMIEKVPNPATSETFTYGWAMRALKLLFRNIILPYKTFGDVYLELLFKGHKFGELRLLKITGASNTTNVATPVAVR
ncbi:MAG: hypothetical protein Q9182_007574, partial [Xanthomendoza sp. 2 TL-2023]